MVNHIRIVRSLFLLSLSFCMLISLLWLGSRWVGASEKQADQTPAGESDLASFERHKRGIGTEADKRYEAARERLCRMPHSTSPLTRGGAWENLGPGAAAGKDLCGEGNRSPLQAAGEGARYTIGAVSPDGKILIGGTTNHGLLRRDASGAWSSIADGAVFTAFHRDLEGVLYASPRGLQLRRSLDNGASFSEAANGIEDDGLPIAPFALDPNESQRLWTGGRALWRSNDGATQWVKAGDTIAGTSQARISALAISPQNSNFVLAGTSEGFIHHHAQALLTGADTKWPATRPRAGFVSSLSFDPQNPSLAYATYSSFGGAHVWRTTDAGASWQPIDGNGDATLPDIPVNSLAIDPENSHRLLIGTDFGIFFTIDGGASWTWENAGPGGAVVESLALHRGSDGTRCFAFTRGAGVWRIDLSEAGAEPQQQQCTFSVGRELISFGAGGGSGNLNVTASAANCAWTASVAQDSQGWLRISSGGSGTGNGTLIYQVQANPATSARKGTMTVAGKTVTIEQSGTGGQCTTTAINSDQTVTGRLESGGCFSRVRSGGTYYAKRYSFTGNFNGPIAITAAAGFGAHIALFTNTSDTPLLQDGAANGANARIPSAGGYFVAPVSATYVIEVSSVQPMRTGDFTLSLFAGPIGCSDQQFSTTRLSFNAGATDGSIVVTTSPRCLWTATASANWISFPTGSQGLGTQSLNFRLEQNTSQDSRRAIISIGGRNLTIEQGGSIGTCTVRQIQQGFRVAGGLYTSSDCQSRTKTPAAGQSPIVADRYAFTAKAGDVAAIFAYSDIFTPYLVLTDANGIILSEGRLRLPANNRNFIAPADGTYFIEVTSFGYSVVAGDYTLGIESPRADCSYQLSPAHQLFDPEGGEGAVTVKTPATCAWLTSTTSSRIAITSSRSGTGEGTVNFKVSPAGLLGLDGGLIIGGQLFPIEQAGSGGKCLPQTLTPGQSVNGALKSADCRSRFRVGTGRFAANRYTFSAKAGQQISILGTSIPYFYLYTAEGNVIASGTGQLSFLSIPVDGQYFLEITSEQPEVSAGYSFTMILNAAGCAFNLSTSQTQFEAAGGSGTLTIGTSAECAWTVGANASWLTINNAKGAGNGTAAFQVAANTTASARTATIMLGTRSLTIEQAGAGGNCLPRAIAAGQTIASRLDPSDCRSRFGLNALAERFSFAGKVGEQVLITALSLPESRALPDYRITLADAAGKAIASGVYSLPSGTGYFTLPATGTYQFEVASTFLTSTAVYAVTLSLSQSGCGYAVTTRNSRFEAAGGAGSFSLSAPQACVWQAQTDSNWLKIEAADAAGSGASTIRFSIDPNSTDFLRTATVQIADQKLSVSQAGKSGTCETLSISPNQRITGSIGNADCNRSRRYVFDGKAGEQVAIQIDSPSSAPAMTLLDPNGVSLGTTFSSYTFPELTLPASGFLTLPASGRYSIDVFPSFSGSQNFAYGLTLLQTQANCNFDISPLSRRFNAAGNTGSINVTCLAGCVWSARSSSNWITIRSAQPGNGSGTLDFVVAPNTGSNRRAGSINIAGRTFSIEQGGTAGSCEIQPIAAGQSITGNLNQGDCSVQRNQQTWTTDLYSVNYKTGQQLVLGLKTNGFTPVLTLTDAFGISLAQVAATNFGQEIRLPAQGSLSLPADGVYLIQVSNTSGFGGSSSYTLSLAEPADCAPAVLPLKADPVESEGGSLTFNVQAGDTCAWMAVSNAPWITIATGAKGSGKGEVRLNVARNGGNSFRSGTVTIAGQILTIDQAGFGGSCKVRPIEPGQTLTGTVTSGDCRTPNSFGGSENFDLYGFTAQAGERIDLFLISSSYYQNMAILNSNGETITSGSSSSSSGLTVLGPVSIPAGGSYGIRISGSGDYGIRLQKSPARCNLLLTPVKIESAKEGGTTGFRIVTGQDCAWLAFTSDAWINLASSSRQGAGPATIEFTVAPNLTEPRVRRGSIRLNNQFISIDQAGNLSNCETVSIMQGQTLRGTYTNGSCGEKKRYRFQGATGDRIALSIAGLDNERWSLDLLDPEGISLLSTIDAARWPAGTGFYTLQRSGAYTLLVGEPVSSGAYRSRDYILSLLSPACNIALSSARQGFDSEGGKGSISIGAEGGCAWTAESAAEWVRITSGAQGAGAGRVDFTVAPNLSVNRRSTSLIIAGQVVFIEQAGVGGTCVPRPILPGEPILGSWSAADCRARIRGREFPGDFYTFEGKAGQQLLLTTSIFESYYASSASMALLGPDGSLLARYTTSAYDERFARLPQDGLFILPSDGTYLIESAPGYEALTADYELNLTLAPAECGYAVSSQQERFDPATAKGSITVTTTASCSWEASSPVSWIKIDSNQKAAGNGTVNFTVAANDGTNSTLRTAFLTIAGRTVRVDQAGRGGNCVPIPLVAGRSVQGQITSADCRASNPASYYAKRYVFSANAGDQVALEFGQSGLSMRIFAPNGVELANGAEPRLPAGGASLTAPATGNYLVEVYTGSSFSQAYTLRLLQSAAGCNYTVSPLSERFESGAGTGSLNVSAVGGCAWTASSDSSWLSISGSAAGSGPGKINYSVAANATAQLRRGRIAIGDQVFVVQQAGTGGSCAPQPLTLGQPVSGTLSSADCQSVVRADLLIADRYSFSARAGEQFFVTVAGGGSLNLSVIDPTGQVVAQGSFVQRLPGVGALSLSLSGTYILEVADSFSRNYQFTATLQPACSFALSPTNLAFAASGGSGTLSVAGGTSCEWVAASNASWLTLNAATAQGSGNGTISLIAAPNPDARQRIASVRVGGQSVAVVQAGAMTLVSSASFGGTEFARESLVSGYGLNLATRTELPPVPRTTVAGTTIKLRDAGGTIHDALISYASPGQINFLIPTAAVPGAAFVLVTASDGTTSSSEIVIANVAPSLFSANSDGKGVAAGFVLRVKADGTRSYEPIARYDEASKSFVAVPIDLGPEGDQVFLCLLGTGFRFRSGLAGVTAQINGLDAAVSYAGPIDGSPGIDQVNMLLPRARGASSESVLTFTVDGKMANSLKVLLR